MTMSVPMRSTMWVCARVDPSVRRSRGTSPFDGRETPRGPIEMTRRLWALHRLTANSKMGELSYQQSSLRVVLFDKIFWSTPSSHLLFVIHLLYQTSTLWLFQCFFFASSIKSTSSLNSKSKVKVERVRINVALLDASFVCSLRCRDHKHDGVFMHARLSETICAVAPLSGIMSGRRLSRQRRHVQT